MENALYLSSLGFKGIWFSPGKEQTNQPKNYMKYIIERSYLKYMIAPEGLLKTSVEFTTGGSLKIINLTELNARSPRADFVVYDEQAQAEEDAYRAAVSILSVTKLGMVFNISTPVKPSIFEDNYKRLMLRQMKTGVQFVFSRTWEDVSYLRDKREWYEEQKRILPGWYFRQEHEACFELRTGAVFKDVIYDPYTPEMQDMLSREKMCSGLDWNPAAGHILVSVKWHPYENAVVVVKEVNLGAGYVAELDDPLLYRLGPYFTDGNSLVMEDGGINIGYIKWFNKVLGETRFNWNNQQWYKEEWDNQDINKMDACDNIIQNGITIYCDRVRFPYTAQNIEEAHWDEEAKGPNPKLAKDQANSPHYLDAFLHAVSEKNRQGMTVEVGRFY
jgi:hypothetical protein